MGLDMYLKRKYYIGSNYDHKEVECNIDIKIKGNKINIDSKNIFTIEENFLYWRKFNALHNYFVNNCQNGIDDCGTYEVHENVLINLINILEQINTNHALAEELLPCTTGFFFGGTDYDDYYYDQVKYTLDELKKELARPDFEDIIYEYSSSW